MKVLGAADVARILGWQTRRANRWLRKSGAGRKVGGRLVTTPASLLRHLPEAFEAWVEQAGADTPEPECHSCDELRAALLTKNREVYDLTRRLVLTRPQR